MLIVNIRILKREHARAHAHTYTHTLTLTQVRAIFEAAAACKKAGVDVRPEIMVPLVGTLAELKDQEVLVNRIAKEVRASPCALMRMHVWGSKR
eukprot:1139950-Pelagomonas_calceolata.AAC.4